MTIRVPILLLLFIFSSFHDSYRFYAVLALRACASQLFYFSSLANAQSLANARIRKLKIINKKYQFLGTSVREAHKNLRMDYSELTTEQLLFEKKQIDAELRKRKKVDLKKAVVEMDWRIVARNTIEQDRRENRDTPVWITVDRLVSLCNNSKFNKLIIDFNKCKFPEKWLIPLDHIIHMAQDYVSSLFKTEGVKHRGERYYIDWYYPKFFEYLGLNVDPSEYPV